VHNEDIETEKRRLGITVFGVELGDFTYCRCCFNLLAWQYLINGTEYPGYLTVCTSFIAPDQLIPKEDVEEEGIL